MKDKIGMMNANTCVYTSKCIECEIFLHRNEWDELEKQNLLP